ncbi:BZ3500_MvSof-1268-A1-R1_Chr12-2g03933 [Microbotryum saponariae]|uniref:BZ3500_MvSof-1268-A1-R1_Chr12-2g03933 protein n=1 Tax=Microbotryum saponariae TaxID=289078 RepID=A0A2X0KLK7_9BASI|nr:BZ3500_MvSof-1268-A1-R1_Chr12-2g03933 [Microbotryum saponariae]
MFKRPFSSKTSTPIRSSDLRRLREELVQSTSFPKSFFFPSLDPAGWTSALTKVALPDKTLICKAATHLDEPVTLYLSPATGNDPLFFRPGKGDDHDLVPTCYAIDLLQQPHNHPLQSQNAIKPPGRDVLPTLVTADATSGRGYFSGASPTPTEIPSTDRNHLSKPHAPSALFLAGISRSSLLSLPDDIQPGSLVTIRCSSSPVIVAIGYLTATRPELLADFDQNKGGKAVTTLHARGDFLWNSGSKESVVGATSTSWPHGSAGTAKDKGQEVPLRQMQDLSVQPKAEERAELAPADVDVVLLQALLLSIRQTLSKPTAPFPLPASSLYSSHILPHRPASPPHSTVEIKKSSYKKLSAFVKFAVKAGYVVSKEVKGELMIMSVHVEHPDVQAVRIYKTLAQAQARAVQASSKGSEADLGPSGSSLSAISSSSSSVVITELFKPTSDVLAIFQDVDHPRPERDLYLPVELKKILTTYITSHSLTHPRDPAFLTPDDTLSHCLLKKSESLDLLKRSDAITRFQSSCQPYYSVARANHPVESFKGTPPAMKISVKNIGKRQVTILTNHETYTSTPLNFYPLQTLLDELKIRTASSVSLQPILGATKKGQAQKMEVVCQGTHDKVVVDMLTSKGVPRRLIVVDLAKAKK